MARKRTVKITEKTLELSKPSVDLIDRDDLLQFIEQYWIGKPNSRIGTDKVSLKDGRLIVPAVNFYRRDLALVQYWDICNAFVEPNGSVQIDLYNGVEITDDERQVIITFCRDLKEKHAEHWARNIKFMDWFDLHGREELDGKTPEEAVEVLRRVSKG